MRPAKSTTRSGGEWGVRVCCQIPQLNEIPAMFLASLVRSTAGFDSFAGLVVYLRVPGSARAGLSNEYDPSL